MDWITHAIWWHVYPLGFTGAPIRPTSDCERELTHRLGHLEAWLDYAVELGVNGLKLGPIFASETHGYDTVDHLSVDPRLGDDADVEHLFQECHARGIRILLDGVFNHVGRNHPLFQSALDGDEHARRYFRWNPDGTPVPFEGHGALVTLNHDEPLVQDMVAGVMCHWLRRGISGWRLDAAYAVPEAFWAAVLPRVREEFPDAWFLGEVIHGDYASIVADATLDSVTQYELWKATWSGLKDGNFFELDWCLQRHNRLLDGLLPLTFVGNHDVNRIASTLGDGVAALAHVVLFTVGGVPAVYYGDEQGYHGTKTEREGGDDEVRPPFPAHPDDLSPIGDWVYRLHQELISLRRREPWLATARTQAVDLQNRAYTYDVVGAEGQRLRVALSLDPTPSARITRDDEELLRHPHD